MRSCVKGVNLYNKAKKIIPGGTQLLSKRPEMFLPDQWPAYYKRCKGVKVWDLDGNVFWDVGISGVSACILGYADSDVNVAVRKAINNGNMCTLNCPEEVELAELLCSLHKWPEMVRFARCGGEAMSIAIRIARAATGRDKIAFCGYHGWHDWYLSANLADDKNLDGQLLPGLNPAGVPRGLTGSVIPFRYNHPEDLDEIIRCHGQELAAIVMEPVRQQDPEPGFLEHAREAAYKSKAVLVFDEVTSGWRMNIGGVHLRYHVNPDIAVFAKAMSNGYPMAAILGIRSVMQAAQSTFISSTYWTERIGPSAALATIRKMQAVCLPEHLCNIGNRVRAVWQEIAQRQGLKIKISGIAPLSVIAFDYGIDSQAIHTLFCQEMLHRGFLSHKVFSVTYAHKPALINRYSAAVDEVFIIIRKALGNKTIYKKLNGPIAHTGFKRLA
ncbi:aminotransferase class III-fold pyridoxal phosphate-dependent enzyme [bacterium]|nr:MAG: aminotransferase class III-fold pyridoxal phosphate-dependent enzyme [bacterium]